MSYGLYDGSVSLARDALNALSSILKKAEEHPDAASFPDARLYEDMLPLSFQVFMVTDSAQKLVARTSGTEPLEFARDLTTFADFHARIAQALEIVEKADKATVDARADEKVPVGLGAGRTVEMATKSYVQGYSLPNLFFHLTTAYAILRSKGVPLGKMDYLSSFIGKFVPQ